VLMQIYVWGLKSRHWSSLNHKTSSTKQAFGAISNKWFEKPLKAAKNQFERAEPIIDYPSPSTSQKAPPQNNIDEGEKAAPYDIAAQPTDTIPQATSMPSTSKTVSKKISIEVTGELPSLDLLETVRNRVSRASTRDETLQKRSKKLQQTLTDYGVRGEVTKVRPGPVVTLYELLPAAGVKASRVVALADDIARSMSSISARVSTIPGHNAIGIELPNPDREMVGLKDLLQNKAYQEQDEKLPLILGKDIGGLPVIADLARMPHLLVAGTTGSGKSVAINTMILSLLYRLTPSQCRFIMIDPKMLELSVYNGIPHVLCPVVTEPKKAVVALKWAVKEMENRYRAMSHLGVRNIDNYNDRLKEARDRNEQITRRVQTGFDPDSGKPLFEGQPLDLSPLPYIVVIVDEMADLMLVAGKDVEAAIQRLAQMARAAGIHLIMATQRPSVDVITGTIKANFPTRISFQVTSKIDSRTILGEQGAEQLLGRGDMLYMAGGGRVTRVHGPFVKDEEVEKVVDYLRQTGTPDYSDDITTEDDDGSNGDTSTSEEAAECSDPLYTHADNKPLQNKEIRDNVRKALAYINDIKTLQADLTQVDPDGTVQKGILKISRPGRMRLTYAKPSNTILICDGTWMIVRDSLIDETSYISLKDTPASLLLSHPLSIDGNIDIQDVREDAALLHIQLVPNDDEKVVRLTLVFTMQPFQLRQWIAQDVQANASTPQEELAQFLEEDGYLAQQILHGENLGEFQEQREILVEATINA
ncbi:uncharacterized protein LOC111319735, partial [Stylophora pistillata]|uniref:uncharacterized protein LOC111319735 n=1 Tax=Stylophora pistillata TaxID=50429 RepID=UPI000C039656